MEDDNESKYEGEEIPKFVVQVSHEAKLKELLRNVVSVEIKLCSDATKEFIKLLEGETGGALLREYIQTSSKCLELLQAWKLRQGKLGLSYILSLISAILSHPDGKYKPDDTKGIFVSRALDKFARLIVDEKLGDLYQELNSKEAKRQNAALLLLASIVRRSSGLASDVAKSFDFKLTIFPKLSEYKQKGFETKRKHSTRNSFIGFGMSFLEVGKPGLLRWVLQQKEMYSGVLRGLGNDDDETIVYVLSTLRDKILTPESLVPPGLRSVLFGSVTLEQLISISGRENGGLAAEMAHAVLVMVCTDPSNGLMPDLKRHPNPLKGNLKRLLDLMKKLRATEIDYHRNLLLAIVKGRPLFGSAYLNEFPYNLDDHASTTWFAAISLAANLVSTVASGLSFDFVDCQLHEPPSLSSPDVQSVVKCVCPRSLTRLVINKGLLHSDSLVKHGTLRFILEALKLFDTFVGALNSSSHWWASLKQDIENEIRIMLPDPQVLLSLLSSLNSHYKSLESSLKRPADSNYILEHNGKSIKKLKTCIVNEETDILVCGIRSSPEIALPGESGGVLSTHDMDESNSEDDHAKAISDLWGFHRCSTPSIAIRNEETYFYSKLLEALKIYHRTMPTLLEGTFDFFKVLPSNPLALPTILQQSLLSLLIEYNGWSSKCAIPMRTQPLMYKHLHLFINLLMYSPTRDIKDQAYILAQAAMLSTGAFDKNPREIGAWFLFLPGYSRDNIFVDDQGIKMFQNLSSVVISFLCDAVSTTGNNLFKYWDLLRCHIYHLEGSKELSPAFSPLVICVLEKCLRLLRSESGTFSLPEKSMISLYVCSTLTYLLQTQVEAGLLSSLIGLILFERFEDRCAVIDISGDFCEWRPLKSLFLFSKSIRNQRTCKISSIVREVVHSDSSFVKTLDEIRRFLKSGSDGRLVEVGMAFSFSMLCTTPAEILQSFPSVISASNFFGVPLTLLWSVFFLEPSHLTDVSKLWPEMFFSGLQKGADMIHGEGIKDEICVDIDSMESASVSFSSFLKQAPFHVLFPTILVIDSTHFLEKIRSLLLAKLFEGTPDYFISSFHQALFWIHQIHSCYRIKPSDELEKNSEMCFTIIEHILAQLLVEKVDSGYSTHVWAPLSTQYVQEVAEVIFCHPAVVASLEFPFHGSEGFTDAIFGESLENFLGLARQGVHKMDYQLLHLLKTISEQLSIFCNGQESVRKVDGANKRIVKAFKVLVQKLFLIFKDRFDQCMKTEDLVPLIPTLYALYTLIHLISPFELFELVHWLFCRVDLTDSTVRISSKRAALSIGLCIGGCSFDLLSAYVQQPYTKQTPFNLFWGVEEKSVDVAFFERTYFQVFEIATRFELDVADVCLLKAVNVANKHKFKQNHCLPLSMVISRVIANTPTKMLSHCIHKMSKTRAKLLFLLTEISPLHLSVFGHVFSDMMNQYLLTKGNVRQETREYSLSDEDIVMLLPTALSYLNSTSVKFGVQFYKRFGNIPSFYWRILLRLFSNWKSYVFGNIFDVEFGELLPSSMEELPNFVYSSLLGKSILMLRHYFALSGDSFKLKERLKLFNSVCPHSSAHDDLLECDVGKIDGYSLQQSLKITNRIVGKINFCRMLLFPEDNQVQSLPKEGDEYLKEVPSEVGSDEEELSRIRFLNMLVRTWQIIVKEFSSVGNSFRMVEGSDCPSFRYLEVFIFRNIVELTANMHNYLIKLHSLPFIEQLARSCLLHRFEDPATLKMLRNVLTSVPEGKFSCIFVLQLLLAHSHFAPTFHSGSKLSGSSQLGMVFRPMSSILGSLVIPHTNRNVLDKKDDVRTSELCIKQLEVVKLLRMLFRIKAQECGSDSETDIGINSRELLFLLLSSYGATLSEIDYEIYNLMHEIESTEESSSGSIAEMDYLWGTVAIKIRKEREQEHDASFDNLNDIEAAEERRRIQFRENLQIDPKLCATTVLYFPYDRTVGVGTLDKFQHDNYQSMHEAYSANIGKIQIYDPVFILRLSIHSLSMVYIEPVEFASLGLLAVTFVSISSPDDDMRKLGYEALGRFKSALEKCQKRKDVMRLRLLLTYLQNGIEEPWQRIPSIIAMFVAEASVVLLDPAHDHYSTISKLLMRSSSVNMKGIPLFHDYFRSSSVNFKTERFWTLRLLYAGLNLDDDAQIYIRNSIFDTLLSFYASPLSDHVSKELILQMVKKSVKLHKMTRYVVEHCGLISWLSSVVSFFYVRQYQDQRSFLSTQLILVLEVVTDVISSRTTIEWLQKHAFEQLAELSSHLYEFLVGGIKLIKEKVSFVNSILQILTSTLKISQKRKIFQPHFTLSLEGLFELCQAVDVCSNGGYSPTAEFGLRAILMSTPPVAIFSMDREKLLKFVQWAISTALHVNTTNALQPEESYCGHTILLEEEQSEESLVSKLLRWLTASVIIGKLSWKLNDLKSNGFIGRSNLETLKSILEHNEKGCLENQTEFGCEDILADAIFYLQHLLGMNYRVLPSVVSALCLLLCSSSFLAESDFSNGHGLPLTSLCLKIHCPAEANPAWRWSFYQPWKDLSSEPTDAEKMDEIHACQNLLVIISNVLGRKSLYSQFLLHQDVENSGVFKWERSVLESELCLGEI